jgi:hypothetical protein
MPESNTENDARSPEHPDADIIIRSSDGVDYRVHTLLLRLASPIFRDMFTLPWSPGVDETKDGLPIVDLSENSSTIQMVLSRCHPAVYRSLHKEIKHLSEISDLIEATRKYEMEVVHRDAIQLLSSTQFIEKEPLRVYGIACRYRLEPEAKLAARYTLQYPLFEDKYITELQSINAEKLYCILVYRGKCSDAAAAVAKNHMWITSKYAFFDCSGASKDSSEFTHDNITILERPRTRVESPTTQIFIKHRIVRVKAHLWWMEYMKRTGIKLQSDLRGQAVRDIQIVNDAIAAASRCSSCSPRAIEDFRRFIDTYAEEVEKKISEV